VKITLDFETRSTVDLPKAGAWKYARSTDTRIFCCAFMIGDKEPAIWVDSYFRNTVQSYAQAPLNEILGCDVWESLGLILKTHPDAIFEAHNAEFERAIWRHVVTRDYKLPDLPIERWRCSAAKAAAHALPRDLERASRALGLSEQKDKEGSRIMMRLSKPKPENQRKKGLWDEDPVKLIKLFRYCLQDVRTEHALSEALADLPPDEQQMWFVDQRINERGIHVDLEAIRSVKTMIASEQIRHEEDAVELCGHGPTKVAETRKWVEEQGVEMPDLTKSRIADVLEDDLPADVRQLLEIRQQAGKSSTSKYDAMEVMACDDGRAYGTLLYHAASTGRWGGKGIQPHNMIRKSYPDLETMLEYIKAQDYDLIELMWDKPMTAAANMIRGMIIASKGNVLIDADWNAIEARILAWLADERRILEAFVKGEDVYKIAAQAVYMTPYNEINDAQRQVGKVIDLSGGYQGGWRAFKSMAKNYGVTAPGNIVPTKEDHWYEFPQYDDEGELVRKGRRLSFRDACFKLWAAPIVKAWREGRPNTQKLWDVYNQAALKAVRSGKTIKAGPVPIYFGVRGAFLFIRLPSGRKLAYYQPEIQVVKTPWGAAVEAVTFMTIDSKTKQWVRQTGYGGKWTENIVQAIARDLLRVALVKLDAIGFPTIFHVHDEIIGDCDPKQWSLEQLIAVMVDLPDWAAGLPVRASGWTGFRYRK